MIIFSERASGVLFDFIKTYNSGVYLLPANVCPIVPLTFCAAKVRFEFVDIDECTLCIDENKCLELFLKNPEQYAGLLFVRTYGYKYNTSNFFRTIKSLDNKLKIIDDQCLCFPDFQIEMNDIDLVLYSTGYSKPLDIGKGGIGIVNDINKIDKFHMREFNGFDIEKYYKEALNQNKKLKYIPNTWLNTDLYIGDIKEYRKRIESEKIKVVEHKNRINNIYNSLLPDEIKMHQDFHNWRFNIRVENKNLILEKIFENNLFASSHYKPSNVLFDKNKHIVSENLFSKVINLFNDKYISSDQAEKITGIIKRYL